MPTSGATLFTLTAGQLINKAMGKIGVKVAEAALEPSELQDGLDVLNMMIKAWAAQGLHLWAKTEGILFLDSGKTNYFLGPAGDEAAAFDDFIGTTSTAAHVTTDTVITVASTTGMLADDTVGIELDDNTRHWTTIVTVDSPTQLTITTGLPSASKSDSSIYTFTTLIGRPNRVLSCRRKTFGQDDEIPVRQWSRQQYFNQVNKFSQGTVVNCYYSPQLDDGRMYVWQTASSVNDLLLFTFERQLEDILIGDDNVDFPAEWLEAIVYNLAARLVDDYDTPLAKADRIAQKAAQFLDDILGWDEEMTSIFLQPDFD